LRNIKKIIIHCSDSTFGTAKLIDTWHTKGNGWSAIGYHYVICNGQDQKGKYLEYKDGAIESGRNLDKIGAHARGYNSSSIGICLIGKGDYTQMQLLSLKVVVSDLMLKYDVKKENVIGHREIKGVTKSCPTGFDMDRFRGEL